MELEELGGLDEDKDQVREDTKKECKELLENTDFFKKKELIKKYGELGNQTINPISSNATFLI